MFGTVKLNKNVDHDKYSYSGYGIGLVCRSHFSYPRFDWGKNVVVFGVDNNLSMHTDNNGKDTLVLDKGPTQGLDDTAIIAEAKYSINFSRSQGELCFSLHYNESNNFLFVNAAKMYQFKARNSEIKT